MPDKVTRWLMFTMALSVAPIVISWIWASASTKDAVSVLSVVRQGDLYLLASSFSLAGIGELIGLNKRYLNAKIVLGGFSALNVVLSISLYGLLRNTNVLANADFVVFLSFFVFGISCAVSTSCVGVSVIGDGTVPEGKVDA